MDLTLAAPRRAADTLSSLIGSVFTGLEKIAGSTANR